MQEGADIYKVRGGADLHGWDIKGRWQVGTDSIQQRLHALVLEGRAGQDRHKLEGNGALAQQLCDLLGAGLLTLQQTSASAQSSQCFPCPKQMFWGQLLNGTIRRYVCTYIHEGTAWNAWNSINRRHLRCCCSD